MSEDAKYRLVAPHPCIADLVDCFWIVEDENPLQVERKIVPDGFPELIFHSGDPYEIRLFDDWCTQARSLAAGQITRHFLLRNTGRTAMLGIKLQPWALARLCGTRMDVLRDQVPALRNICPHVEALEAAACSEGDADDRIAALTQVLSTLALQMPPPDAVVEAVRRILASRGTLPVSGICAATGLQPRQLERAYARWIGLTPKFHSRIVRFSTIFKAATEGTNLGDLSFDAGYYDQPHFTRNFKAFTGENPSAYAFTQANMANLFLRRP